MWLAAPVATLMAGRYAVVWDLNDPPIVLPSMMLTSALLA